MRRTKKNIKDPLFRFFEREVNVGIRLLEDIRCDLNELLLICRGEKKPTNHHRSLMSDLAKGQMIFYLHVDISVFVESYLCINYW
jgi:dynein heavy chain 1